MFVLNGSQAVASGSPYAPPSATLITA